MSSGSTSAMPPPALVKDYATDMGLRPASVEPGEKFLDASGKSFISEYLLSENDEASKKEFVEKGANFWLVYYSKPFIEKTGANNYNSGFGWVGDEASAVHFRNERKCRVDSYKIPKNEIGNVKKKFDENRHWAGLDTKAPGGSLSRNPRSYNAWYQRVYKLFPINQECGWLKETTATEGG